MRARGLLRVAVRVEIDPARDLEPKRSRLVVGPLLVDQWHQVVNPSVGPSRRAGKDQSVSAIRGGVPMGDYEIARRRYVEILNLVAPRAPVSEDMRQLPADGPVGLAFLR